MVKLFFMVVYYSLFRWFVQSDIVDCINSCSRLYSPLPESVVVMEAQNCPYAMIEDRGEAIKAAMDEAEGKTIFLITGKGNETRQKYGCEYLDCKSDTQYVKEYLAEYDKKHQ